MKKKPREKSRSKAANEIPSIGAELSKTSAPRGGRGRGGVEGGRGGKSRGTERGRGGSRGGRGGAGATLNGSRTNKTSDPHNDSTGWVDPAATSSTAGGADQSSSGAWGGDTSTVAVWGDNAATTEAKQASNPEKQKSSLIPEGTKKSWASMLAKPKPVPAVPKVPTTLSSAGPEISAQKTADAVPTIEGVSHEPAATEWDTSQDNDEPHVQNEATVSDVNVGLADTPRIASDSLPPPKDPLTEDNLEHLPDQSGPPTTETVASTRDPRSTLGTAHPSLQISQQEPVARPSLGGYVTTAQKAAGQSSRSLSFQKLKEQQDAVVMPGNHAIDRAAVQFGSMNLGSDVKALDVDDEREEVETRGQPPQQSPSQPRASLPPVPRSHQAPSEPPAHDSISTTKQAPGLPLPSHTQVPPISQSPQAPSAQSLSHSNVENPNYGSYGSRYGASAFQQEQNGPPQKAYDPFSSQLYPHSQNDPQSMYSGLSQAPGQMSQPSTSQAGNYSQVHGEYGSHYPSDSSRGGYSNYYSNYNQPSTSMQENVPPQRSTSGFGTGETSFGTGHTAQSQTQSRFGEGQASGHNTPNPPMGSQQHVSGHAHQNQPMHQQGHGHSAFGGHPYGGPYGHSGYYQQYGSQGYPNYYGYNQHGYGGPYGGKGGMYGGPGHQGYGMSSHASYDATTSPATTGTFGGSSLQGRESSMSGLNDYPRSGSTQPPSQSQHTSATASGFGGMADSYGRSSSGFGGHGQGFGAPTTNVNEESIKPLHDSKTGPSPLGQAGRPNSAFNTNPNAPGYGPPSNQQGGFGSGGYPGHLGALHSQYSGSGYGGIGGLGGHGASHGNQTGYGYGGGFGNSSYGGRGGWGSQYGSQYSGH